MINIGPAGNVEKDTIASFKRLFELGIHAQEIEFVRGVYLDNVNAKKLGEAAKECKISLSIHAPYYINLLSKDKEKLEASKKRILDSVERGHYLNAKVVVFHPGYYQDIPKDIAFGLMKKEIQEMQDIIRKNGWKTKLAPETTGKVAQFGELDELLKLIKETKCHYCVDFSHLLARYQEEVDYESILKKLKPLGDIHAHFQGIEYTARGEVRHLLTPESDIDRFAFAIKKVKPKITIISESPDPLGDTLKIKKRFEELKII